MTSKTSLIAFLLLAPLSALAQIELGTQLRYYPQLDKPWTDSAALLHFEAHPYAREGDWRHAIDFVADGRISEEQAHADLRELIYIASNRQLELRFGQGREFWGVTEAVQWVDVINQEDWLSSLDGDEKLGQPMASAAWTGDYGIFKGWLLPRFRPRRFADNLRAVLDFPIADGAAVYESSRERQHTDFALRWSHYFGSLDVAISYFDGTAREPRLPPCARQGSGRPGTQNGPNCDLDNAFAPPESSPLELLLLQLGSSLGLTPSEEELADQFIEDALADIDIIPHYDQIERLGLELQWVLGGWALKFEGRRQQQLKQTQHAFSAGFEYTTGAPFSWPADFGYLIEYLNDDRDSAEQLVLFNNDLLLGFRATVSDVAGSQLLAGVVLDLDGEGMLYSVEASRRLGENWKLVLETRIFSELPEDSSAAILDSLDLIELGLTRYF